MEENYKMINGVIFAEEKKNEIVLLGKDGLYRLNLEEDGWSGVYVLPGEREKVEKNLHQKTKLFKIYIGRICRGGSPHALK